MGYSPWGRKESDMTKRLHFHFHFSVLRLCFNYEDIIEVFPGGSDSKASACNEGDLGSIPGSGSSPEKEMATHSRTLA